MKQIIKYGGEVYRLLGHQECYLDRTYKPSRFCIVEKVADGYLVYHTMTREMLLMTEEEYQHLFLENWFGDCHNFRYLVRHWYLVNEGTDETAVYETLNHIYKNESRRKNFDKFDRYTILTTMNCNARCPYCYEHGRKKRSMSTKIAGDVVDYIKRTAMPGITLSWFGGEPLVNSEVITIICQRLAMDKIHFNSSMVSNGYLFDQMDMNTMLNVWKLKKVQITLDGTEERYNATKDYVYPDTNGYERVMDNINRLLSAGIKVDVRMNLSKDNADDIEALADILHEKYAGRGLTAYAWPLFEGEGNPPLELTNEERKYVYDRYIRLQDYLVSKGLTGRYDLKQMKSANCMADNHRSVVIMPEGNISVCEHHSDDELVGSIYGETYDADILNSWQEPLKLPECRECVLFPQCTKLKKCSTDPCLDETRKFTEHRIRQAMRYEYERSVAQK